MPLLKGNAGKATPHKAIAYITRKDKAKFIDVQNLFIDEDYAKQFEETAARFGKGAKHDERKYYHFKLSPDRADGADPYVVQEYAKACAEKMFSGCECVIATHTDTQTVHAHIVVNAVHPITGKKLHFNDDDYTRLKDMANEIGEQFGFTALDFRKKAKHKRTIEERHIILKGGTSWKEDLREVIEEAKQSSSTQEEFISHLALYGVTVTRSRTEYSYLHPEKKKAVRGLKLGENYTKKEIDIVIETNRNKHYGKAVGGFGGTGVGTSERQTETNDGQPTSERGIEQIRQEMQRLDRAAEYAHRGLDYDSEVVREHERLERERIEREREESRKRNEELARRNAEIKQPDSNGNKPGNQKNDNYFGK